jgi:endonuclease YncB( thermonuclease family)
MQSLKGSAPLFLAALLVCDASIAATLSGRVIHVIDGDGLVVLVGERRLTVRLANIDAPKQPQRYAIASRQSLSAICGGEMATLELSGKRRNDSVLAQVTCAGTNANAEQVRRGMAWVHHADVQRESLLHGLQNEAQHARRGLWAQAHAVPP